MSTPFKMKGFSGFVNSPLTKKVTNEDGSTTKTTKNILTGRTRTVTKDSGDDYTKKSKTVTVKDKKGTVRKVKHRSYGEDNRENVVGGVKGKGSSPDVISTTKYNKKGEKKSKKDVTTKGVYDTRKEYNTGIQGKQTKVKRKVDKTKY